MSTEDLVPLSSLLASPNVAPFLSEDFHVANFTSSALKGSSASETVDHVATQIKRIDQAISNEVAENQSILVANVRRSNVAERQLQVKTKLVAWHSQQNLTFINTGRGSRNGDSLCCSPAHQR